VESTERNLDYILSRDVTSLLLTGGTGFFGRSLLRCYAKMFMDSNLTPPHVTVLTRSSKNFLKNYPEFGQMSWLSFYEGNIMSGLAALPDKEFSHVLHAAAESIARPGITALQRFDENTQGTRNVLEFSIRHGAKRFLYISSGGAYGPQPLNMKRIPESYLGMPDPLSTESSYGIAKRQAEHLCALYHQTYGLDTVIARCFAFVGPDLALDEHFAIGNFIHDALMADAITVNGDGLPLRTYMYQEDLAEWLYTLLLLGDGQEAYNVGSDEVVSIGDLAHEVKDILAPNKKVVIKNRSDHFSDVRNRYIPDIDKARNKLNLDIKIKLKEAISLTAMKYLKNSG
jgi:UDP-glucuronate decarboxylase